jgi:hypothetical protein
LLCAIAIVAALSYGLMADKPSMVSTVFNQLSVVIGNHADITTSVANYVPERVYYNVMFFIVLTLPFLLWKFDHKIVTMLVVAIICGSGLMNLTRTTSSMSPGLEEAYSFINESYHNSTIIAPGEQGMWIVYFIGRHASNSSGLIFRGDDPNIILYVPKKDHVEPGLLGYVINPFSNSTYHIPFSVCDLYENGAITYYDLSIGFDSNLIVDEPCLKEVFRSGNATVLEVVR